MNVFPDTSFLYALLRTQTNSEEATVWMERYRQTVPISWMVSWEFRHSLEFHGGLNFKDPNKGIPLVQSQQISARFKEALRNGAFRIAEADWSMVCLEAELLTAKYAATHGIRQLDTLHLATAKHLGCDTFLTFDKVQAQVAREEHLEVPF